MSVFLGKENESFLTEKHKTKVFVKEMKSKTNKFKKSTLLFIKNVQIS